MRNGGVEIRTEVLRSEGVEGRESGKRGRGRKGRRVERKEWEGNGGGTLNPHCQTLRH
jgi:hypothetical protein